MKVLMSKNINNTLSPAYNSDYNFLQQIKKGEIVEVEIKRKRNIKFHKKFFALLNLAYENQDRYNNIDHLRRDVTIEAGFYDIRYNLHGVEIYEPKSISFAAMDDLAFSEFYSAVLDVIVKFLGLNKQEIEENIEQFF